ncbi:MAG: DUF433 domain-containing protein [Armatimonadetes bacterium]|nr:DUF433 domain-containing protein [Armatimonadota bacterium]
MEDEEALLERVMLDPDIQGGRPVIKGTRVPVSRIVGAFSAGADFTELREDYGIEDEDIKAALAYAALGSSANKPEISC